MRTNLLRLLTELSSRKFIARLIGKFSKSSISKILLPRFIKTYQINADEAEKHVTEYKSLNEFFTRRLKENSRPLDPDPHALISPVDARITGMGAIHNGQVLNVKGQDYTIEDLLNRSPRMINYKHGFYYVLYLSPSDYHRIHAPVAGKINEKDHLPGKVYPVNDFALHHINKVLSRNERLITYMQHEFGEVAIAKVGAMNVSSIQYTDSKVTQLAKGDELAYFEFGSTIVLLMESGTFTQTNTIQVGDVVKMGQTLGIIHQK